MSTMRAKRRANWNKDKNTTRRFRWQMFHQAIEGYVIKYVTMNKILPTYSETAKALGVSGPTVCKYFHDLKLADVLERFKAFDEKVMIGLASAAMKGNPIAAKTFFQLVHDWSEKNRTDVTTAGQPINKTCIIRIGNKDIPF